MRNIEKISVTNLSNYFRQKILIMGYQEIKLEWPEVPRLKLKFLFLTHLVLISWSSLGKFI